MHIHTYAVSLGPPGRRAGAPRAGVSRRRGARSALQAGIIEP